VVAFFFSLPQMKNFFQFVHLCLRYRAEDRPRAREALCHPFLQGMFFFFFFVWCFISASFCFALSFMLVS
jgi:hypothetical protein